MDEMRTSGRREWRARVDAGKQRNPSKAKKTRAAEGLTSPLKEADWLSWEEHPEGSPKYDISLKPVKGRDGKVKYWKRPSMWTYVPCDDEVPTKPGVKVGCGHVACLETRYDEDELEEQVVSCFKEDGDVCDHHTCKEWWESVKGDVVVVEDYARRKATEWDDWLWRTARRAFEDATIKDGTPQQYFESKLRSAWVVERNPDMDVMSGLIEGRVVETAEPVEDAQDLNERLGKIFGGEE